MCKQRFVVVATLLFRAASYSLSEMLLQHTCVNLLIHLIYIHNHASGRLLHAFQAVHIHKVQLLNFSRLQFHVATLNDYTPELANGALVLFSTVQFHNMFFCKVYN